MKLLTGFVFSIVQSASIPGVNELVINEILFNPRPGGFDYVELYNRSDRTIDLRDVSIANRSSSTQAIANVKAVSTESILLPPGGFVVLTEDSVALQQQYYVKDPSAVIKLKSMPSFPDDKGWVVILNKENIIIDELNYSEQWHFALISNREGVALERIDYNQPTQLQDNWHSAATDIGHGTPSYLNSQNRVRNRVEGSINVQPDIFSPDNDGRDDVMSINYLFTEPNNVCTITVFDVNGRVVRNLVRNVLCGTEGSFVWDGLGEKGTPLSMGIYILLVEVFNLQGKQGKYKLVVTLARRLQ